MVDVEEYVIESHHDRTHNRLSRCLGGTEFTISTKYLLPYPVSRDSLYVIGRIGRGRGWSFIALHQRTGDSATCIPPISVWRSFHIMASQTISSILDSQALLVQAAAEALPHQFSQCTYTLGHIRQAVYLCLSCREPRGICSACSIACHGDHEQVELFPKRAFRCDCPTRALPHPCTLHKTLEEENKDNRYGLNFEGTFCRCGREYDAANERETMIQCLACEVRSIRNRGACK